jgi:ABC-type multidrug transport system fused ATPase/permease subunit
MILLNSIVTNRWFRAAAAAAFVQQLLVASGTYLLGDVTTRLPSEGVPWLSCLVMFACMAFSGSLAFYIMNVLSLRSKQGALGEFFERYFSVNYQKPLFWRVKEERTQRHDMMCRESQDAVQEGNAFVLDVWTTGWNIVLNTVAVVLVIGPESGAVILAAGIVSSLIVHFASARIATDAVEEIEDQNRLNSHLNSSWDNLTLGNKISYRLWHSGFLSLFKTANASALRSLKSRERVLAVGNFLTTAVVVGSVLIQAKVNENNIAAVIGLFAMLPRSLQINMHVQIIQSYWAGWQRLRERLTVAGECLQEFPEPRASEFIDASAIQIVGHSMSTHSPGIHASGDLSSQQVVSISASDLLHRVADLRSGRLTVRGKNGAGKSVLLSFMKDSLGDAAFYLPAHHELALPGVELSQSHGERALSALDAVAVSDTGVRVLLLDEWDANLSPENRAIVSAKIETLAQSRLVIEVRHNQDSLTLVPSYA